MSLTTALAISIGVLGAVATYLYLSPFALGVQIWAAFIAWGSFYHSGGGEAGLKSSLAGNLAGVVVGWLTLLTLALVPAGGELLGAPLWPAVVVGAWCFVMVMLANIPLFAVIPAMAYGFAAAAGYGLLSNNAGETSLLSADVASNPLLCIGLSMIGGALFGYVSEKVAGVLAK